MKIACVGTAPHSVRAAPYGDKAWQIWGCAPGLYPVAPRVDVWFELHRWEPPVIGDASRQVAWFSPEYCAWMAQRQHVVWMRERVDAIPNSQALPWQDLVAKYGHFFFTSSLAWMAAMAIEAILLNRELLAAGDSRAFPGEDCLGFWGVDMSTIEEYVLQRQGCQFFATLAASMGIKIVVPPESDLMMPPFLYGIDEGSPRHIKSVARQAEIHQRKAALEAQIRQAEINLGALNGNLESEIYHFRTWTHEGEIKGTRFEDIFSKPVLPAPPPPPPPAAVVEERGLVMPVNQQPKGPRRPPTRAERMKARARR